MLEHARKFGMFRMVAVIACWSHDYWVDVNHADPHLRERDAGPNGYLIMLIENWSAAPSSIEVAGEVDFLQSDYLTHADGHERLHSYSVLNESEWNSMILGSSLSISHDYSTKTGADADFYSGRWQPVVVQEMITVDEASSVLNSSGATVVQMERT